MGVLFFLMRMAGGIEAAYGKLESHQLGMMQLQICDIIDVLLIGALTSSDSRSTMRYGSSIVMSVSGISGYLPNCHGT